MILRYGDFRSVIERASGWKYGTKLELEGKGKSKFDAPLVFYDPVDSNRNVASALSMEKFTRFIHACKEYLARPDERFFFPNERKPMAAHEITKLMDDIGMKVVVVRTERPDIIDDNLYPQARKSQEGISALLQHEGFLVQDKSLLIDRTSVFMAYLIESDLLSNGKKHVGPPIWMENSQEFLKRWRIEGLSAPYIEDGRWVTIVPRKKNRAKSVIEDGLATAALGSAFKNLAVEVFDDKECRNEDFWPVLSMLFDKRMPWEI